MNPFPLSRAESCPRNSTHACAPSPRATRLGLCPVLSLFLVTTGVLPAAEIHVPGAVPTIQGAIDLAVDGDTVVVSPGTYFESIDFLGKAITVRSSAGADATVIDGMGVGVVVRFESGEGLSSVLEGFTIRGGFGSWGGGIVCHGASPTIRGNAIRENHAVTYGGGIDCVDSAARIEGNTFLGNSASSSGQYPAGCSVFDCTTHYFGVGGGISIRGGSVTVTRCRFSGNHAGARGGGIFVGGDGEGILDTCIVEENTSIGGGAIACIGSGDVTIENVLVRANVVGSHLDIFGIAVTHAAAGASLCVNPGDAATVSVSHATIVDDQAGLLIWDETESITFLAGGGGAMTLRNSIVRRSNPLGLGPVLSPGIDVSYSNVVGGYIGLGNFDADPQFVAGPLGDLYLAQPAAGQGSLSPCVDAGDPADTVPEGRTTRSDHGPDTGVVDLGYHFVVEEVFRRGDCNGDLGTDIADAVHLLVGLFPPSGGSGAPFSCEDACDANDDGSIDISDAIGILDALFGNATVALPGPAGACGVDSTTDLLECAAGPTCGLVP